MKLIDTDGNLASLRQYEDQVDKAEKAWEDRTAEILFEVFEDEDELASGSASISGDSFSIDEITNVRYDSIVIEELERIVEDENKWDFEWGVPYLKETSIVIEV